MPTTEKAVWWDNNKPMAPEQFEVLWADFQAHAASRELFVQDLHAGADPAHRLNARIFIEYAWHALFIRHLLRKVPEASELAGFKPEFTVINLPSFQADPKRHGARSRDGDRLQLRQAAGADRRHRLRRRDQEVGLHRAELPAAAAGRAADALLGQRRRRRATSALFFGLSGTGKTTLSADPKRTLIGDDEHGWGDDGIFNFEGGCYAKTHPPLARRPSRRSGPPPTASAPCWRTSILDPATRVPDFDDGR